MTASKNSERGQKTIALALARCGAIAALRRNGVRMGDIARTQTVLSAIRLSGFARRPEESDLAYMNRYARSEPAREKVAPRTATKFRELAGTTHPRPPEIDAHPPLVGKHGVGNGLNLGGGH
jgi:hypothetical protein